MSKHDVDAWVLAFFAAPLALLAGSLLMFSLTVDQNSLFIVFYWNGIIPAFYSVAYSLVLSPIPFYIAERIGIVSISRATLSWIALCLAVTFVALFFQVHPPALHTPSYLWSAVIAVGVMLNTAVFGVAYSRANRTVEMDARKSSARHSL